MIGGIEETPYYCGIVHGGGGMTKSIHDTTLILFVYVFAAARYDGFRDTSTRQSMVVCLVTSTRFKLAIQPGYYF